MSAKGRGPVTGGELEQNFTPGWVVDRLLEAWTPPAAGSWTEPGAGNGAIIQAVNRKYSPWWYAIEIDNQYRDRLRELAQQVHIGNFLDLISLPEDTTLTMGNPAYSIAMKTIETSMRLAPHAEIVLLLRVNFLAGGERQRFMSTCPPMLYVMPDRPSFTGDGDTDATEYAWMRWVPPVEGWGEGRGNAVSGVKVLRPTPVSIRKGRA